MSNPNSDEAYLQHYGEVQVAHVEAYHNWKAGESQRYQDYWNGYFESKKSALDPNIERDRQRRVYGTSDWDSNKEKV